MSTETVFTYLTASVGLGIFTLQGGPEDIKTDLAL